MFTFPVPSFHISIHGDKLNQLPHTLPEGCIIDHSHIDVLGENFERENLVRVILRHPSFGNVRLKLTARIVGVFQAFMP